MKNKKYVFLIIVLLLLCGCNNSDKMDEKNEINSTGNSDVNVTRSYGYFKNISVDQYLNLLNANTKSIIYIFMSSCSWCDKEIPVLRDLMKGYNLKIYFLNTNDFFDSKTGKFTEEGYKLINSGEPYKSKQTYTIPNTIIVQNGQIIDGIYNYAEYDELKEMFERNQIIK